MIFFRAKSKSSDPLPAYFLENTSNLDIVRVSASVTVCHCMADYDSIHVLGGGGMIVVFDEGSGPFSSR